MTLLPPPVELNRLWTFWYSGEDVGNETSWTSFPRGCGLQFVGSGMSI